MREPLRVDADALKKTANKLRVQVLEMITRAGSGHPGGSLSALDMILALYFGELRHDPTEPTWPNRDRFVLSKGHGVPALYAVMAEAGYFKADDLMTLRELGSPFQGHPANTLLPGIEASTGSLGQGLSVAQGIALAARRVSQQKQLSQPAWHVYALVGDGELQEGQIWEAAMSASHMKVGNLTMFVDRNNGQIDGLVDDVMGLEPLQDKFKSFGWHTLEIDGHCIDSIRRACDEARACTDRPSAIIARTVKGKGVSFLEADTVGWHGKALSQEQIQKARAELLGDLK